MERPLRSRRIRRLPPQLANQIAAGEVVERPASVAKELLENSLDAGADVLDVDVEKGGVGLLRVRDNGCGIHPDDLPLSISAYATSKIASAEELERVGTLGFRGEALASIGAVARLTITSRHRDFDTAFAVRCDGPLASAERVPAAHPPGTTVEVRDLFHNTPARRKFLRTERTEFGHIEETVRRIALARPDVRVRLHHNGKGVLDLRPAGPDADAKRLADVYGRRFVNQAVYLAFEAGDLRLSGWAAPPEASRGQADRQYFYVNGRMVRDRLVTHAVRRAYGEALYPGRHPAYVLFLELDAAAVDVNVHPTKHEVRFRDARRVHDFLFGSLREALGRPLATPLPQAPSAADGVAETEAFYRAADRSDPQKDTRASVFGRPLGTVGGRYIVAEYDGGLLLVDAPAARRALVAARLRGAVAEGGAAARPLLVPAPLRVGEAAAAAVEAQGALLGLVGLEVGRLAPGELVLRRVPVVLSRVEPEGLLQRVVDYISAASGQPSTEGLIDAFAAAEASPPMHDEEAGALLTELEHWLGGGARDSAYVIYMGTDRLAACFAVQGGR